MLAKKRAATTEYDKEFLYDTIIKLKKTINQLKQENSQASPLPER